MTTTEIHEELAFPVVDTKAEKTAKLAFYNSPTQFSLDGDLYLTAIITVRIKVTQAALLTQWQNDNLTTLCLQLSVNVGGNSYGGIAPRSEIKLDEYRNVSGDTGYVARFVVHLLSGQNDLILETHTVQDPIPPSGPTHHVIPGEWSIVAQLSDRLYY